MGSIELAVGNRNKPLQTFWPEQAPRFIETYDFRATGYLCFEEAARLYRRGHEFHGAKFYALPPSMGRSKGVVIYIDDKKCSQLREDHCLELDVERMLLNKVIKVHGRPCPLTLEFSDYNDKPYHLWSSYGDSVGPWGDLKARRLRNKR